MLRWWTLMLVAAAAAVALTPSADAQGSCVAFANDCFADATPLSSPTSVSANTTGYTAQAGEPLVCSGAPFGKTAWFRFNATTNGTGHVDTLGSVFDTVAAVYTGASVGNLTSVGCNDDRAPGLLESSLNFTCVAGTTYRIQVGGYNNASGFLTLNLSGCALTPPSAPRNVTATGGISRVDLAWIPPLSDGGAPIVGYNVYRNGTLFRSLGNVLSFADLNVTAGETHSYRVSARNSAGEGDLSQPPQSATATCGSSNDCFATPSTLASGATLALNTSGYTTEFGEQTQCASALYGRTAWFVFDAIFTGTANVNSNGSLFDTVLSVYTGGPGLSGLVRVDCNDDVGGGPLYSSVGFGCVAGSRYYVQLGGYQNASGYAEIRLNGCGTTVPTAPRDLAATASNARVDLGWSPPESSGGSPVTGYRLYRGGALYRDLVQPPFVDTNVTNGVTYAYQVSALNDVGEGPRAAEVSATPRTSPSTPRNFTAVPSDARVDLTWLAPLSDGGAPVTAYRLYRGDSIPNATLYRTLGNVTSFADVNVTNGQSYAYILGAVNLVGEGMRTSTSASPGAPPSAPRDLAAVASDARVDLAWQPPATDGGSPVIGYDLYRGTTSGGETLYRFLGTGLAFGDTNVTNGVTYSYQLVARNNLGNSPRSNETSATPRTVPGAPQALTAAPGNARVDLAWQAPVSNGGAPITGYQLYRGTSNGGETLYRALGSASSFADTNVTNGQPYFYQVSALNAAGEGARSAERNTTPRTVASAPQNLTAGGSDARADLTWDAPLSNGGAAVTGYRLHRGTTSGGETFYRDLGDVRAFADVNVTNGQPYFYQVSALNAAGEGARSNEANATPRTAPTVPRNLTATPGNVRVDLAWQTPLSNGGATITAYSLYRGAGGGAESLYRTLGAVTSFEDVNVSNGVSYGYRVSARNVVGEGPLSSPANATPRTMPGAPSSIAVSPGAHLLNVSWTRPASDGGNPITGYAIHRGSGANETLYRTLGDVLTFRDTNVTDHTTYSYRVSARNVAGEGSLSGRASGMPQSQPTAPLGLNATGSAGRINLTWLPPASNGGSVVQSYQVYRGVSNLTLYRTIGNVTGFADTNVSGGTRYDYEVVAVNAIGPSPASNRASIVAYTRPGTPTGLVASAGPSAGKVSLDWGAPPDNGGAPPLRYKVYRLDPSTGQYGLIATTSASDYLDSNRPHAPQSYKVTALNQANHEGLAAGPATATPWGPPGPPRNVTALPGTSEEEIVVRWEAPANDGGRPVASYWIARAPHGSSNFTTLGSVTSTARQYTDVDVPRATFDYRVRARNNVGENGTVSAIATAEPLTTQDDPGHEGDASDLMARPTVLLYNWTQEDRRGDLRAGGNDGVDVYSFLTDEPASQIVRMCHGAEPFPYLDILIRLVSPDGVSLTANSGGRGEAEEICTYGPGGVWKLTVELTGTGTGTGSAFAVEPERDVVMLEDGRKAIAIPESLAAGLAPGVHELPAGTLALMGLGELPVREPSGPLTQAISPLPPGTLLFLVVAEGYLIALPGCDTPPACGNGTTAIHPAVPVDVRPPPDVPDPLDATEIRMLRPEE